MNILGHSYIATKVFSGRRDLLIIGSLLPESYPFIKGNPFSFEEIHEGGERLLEFLDRSYPVKRNLALGMLAHSAGFGADQFNREIEKYAGSRKEEILKQIADCSSVDLKIAEYRLHNFLWWGVDCWILREYPKFVGKVRETLKTVDTGEVSGLLGQAFEKERTAVKRVVKTLFEEIYRLEDLTSVEGLARTWARQAVGLPEHDRVDVSKATEVFRECARLVRDDWQSILERAEAKVGENLRPFIEKEGVKPRSKEQKI